MSALDDIIAELIDLRREVATLKRDLAASHRAGTVCDVDAEKGYRLQFGLDEKGEPKKSPWLPHPEQGADSKSWVPLAVGQVCMLVSPPGDPRKAFLMRGGFCDQYGPPSESLEEDVFERGNSRLEVRKNDIDVKSGEKIEMTVDRSFVELTPDKARIGVRTEPDSDAATEIEITQGNIVAIVRGPQGQVIRRVTVL